jgi:hypothetical protein
VIPEAVAGPAMLYRLKGDGTEVKRGTTLGGTMPYAKAATVRCGPVFLAVCSHLRGLSCFAVMLASAMSRRVRANRPTNSLLIVLLWPDIANQFLSDIHER